MVEYKIHCNVCGKTTKHYFRMIQPWKEIEKLNCYDCSSFCIYKEGKLKEWHYYELGELKMEVFA